MMMVKAIRRTGIAIRRTELTAPPVAAEKTRPETAIIGPSSPTRKKQGQKILDIGNVRGAACDDLAVPKQSISAAEKLCTLAKT